MNKVNSHNLNKELENFFKIKKNIIAYCTAYKDKSAGIKTIYFLLSFLKKKNFAVSVLIENSTLGIDGHHSGSITNNSDVHSLSFANLHLIKKKQVEPIVIYPDSTRGNPLKASKFIRIVNYFYGELNNNKPDINKEYLIFFGKEIEKNFFLKYPNFPRDRTMIYSLPVFPLSFVKNIVNFSERTEEYYYSHKANILGIDIPENIKKRAKKLDPHEKNIIEKISKAKCIHLFEETAIAYEAMLCGAVVNYHPNGLFLEKPLINWLGDNTAIIRLKNPTNFEINAASKKLDDVKKRYVKWIDEADKDLSKIIEFISDKQCNFDTKKGYKLLEKNLKTQVRHFKNIEFNLKLFLFEKTWFLLKLILPKILIGKIKKYRKYIKI